MELKHFFASGSTRYFQPQTATAGQTPLGDTVDTQIQKRLARLVSYVAFGLPLVLLAGVLTGSCFRDSISHFYYAQFLGSIFVGLLVFIGGFLIAYTGEHWLETLGSTVAGIGAAFIAIFPTTGNGCEKLDAFHTRVFVNFQAGDIPIVEPIPSRGYFTLFDRVEHLHLFAAAGLFIYLGVYCWVVMTRIVVARHCRDGHLIKTKFNRNIVYRLCALAIFLCVALLGGVGLLLSTEGQAAWNSWNLTFVFETVALWAFGLAWLIKGRMINVLNDPVAGTPCETVPHPVCASGT